MLNSNISSVVVWVAVINTILYGIEVWDTSEKDVKSLGSAHKDMPRIVQDLVNTVITYSISIHIDHRVYWQILWSRNLGKYCDRLSYKQI